MGHSQPLAITAGEPAGIGVDLCLQLALQKLECEVVIIADKMLLQQRANLLGLNVQLHDYHPSNTQALPSGSLNVLHLPTAQPVHPGQLNAANSPYVLNTLRRAVQSCLAGEFSGMVTAPVHKAIINEAGIPFTGHTEFLAQHSNTQHVVMMLVGGGLRVALATTHLALRDVPDAITPALLTNVLRIMELGLIKYFCISQPRILVAGLNPHAGEDGHLGREEIEVIIPILNQLRAQGMQVSPPLPADTLFTSHRLAECDCVLAMYHDQGLPVLKHASFGHGVNVTLGLPFIRTSVDHGTALDLAGSGRAEVGSLLEAIQLAADMAHNAQAT
jgi:4-hydroxythreonine-4-phosphate dehydrogenase